MINIALYKPDIPQNTAAIIRLGACLGLKIHIIEPCGFNLNDKRFQRVVMDYLNLCSINRYKDYDSFKKSFVDSRIILLTTKSKKSFQRFKFKKNDVLLFGSESKGVPKQIHKKVDFRLRIPMQEKVRSLNISMAVAIVSSENIRQNNLFK